MDLFTIHNDLIANRTGDAWYLVPSNGPTFHERWQWGSSGGDGFAYVTGEHHSQAVCREEPSLTLAWGLDPWADGPERHWEPEWASALPDSEVRRVWADLFWNQALVDRVTLLMVDGGRGLVPDPGSNGAVSTYELSLAELIADLDDTPADYRPRALIRALGFTLRVDSERHGAGSQ